MLHNKEREFEKIKILDKKLFDMIFSISRLN